MPKRNAEKARILLDLLKQYRIYNRISQKEIRVQYGASASDFSKLENGQRIPKLDEVLALLSAYNISVVDLIYWLCDAGVDFQETKQFKTLNQSHNGFAKAGTLEIRYHTPR